MKGVGKRGMRKSGKTLEKRIDEDRGIPT